MQEIYIDQENGSIWQIGNRWKTEAYVREVGKATAISVSELSLIEDSLQSGLLAQVNSNSSQIVTTDKQEFGNKRLNKQEKLSFAAVSSSDKYWLSLYQRWRAAFLQLQHRVWFQYLGYPVAGVVEAMVFGQEDHLSQDLRHQFKTIGMSHVLVASGSNITLIYSLVEPITRRFRRILATLCLAFSLVFYVSIVGWQPPLVRALITTVLKILSGKIFFRQFSYLWCLMLTGVIMVSWNPAYLTNLSFQLSFAASLGIGVYAIIIQKITQRDIRLLGVEVSHLQFFNTVRNTKGDRFWVSLCDLVGVTLFSLVATAPIIIPHFREFSMIGVVSNPLLLQFLAVLVDVSLVLLGLAFFAELFPVMSWLPFLVGQGLTLSGLLVLKVVAWLSTWTGFVLIWPTE